MSFNDAFKGSASVPSDFTLLEGLYQLAVSGHTDDWEFERLNNAVYERLLSSYGEEKTPHVITSNALID